MEWPGSRIPWRFSTLIQLVAALGAKGVWAGEMTLHEAKKVVADHFQFNAAANLQDLAEAERRMDEVLARRHAITDKSTVGLLTLNGASIVGVFTALQVGQEALAKLGISIKDISGSMGLFLFGAMCALLAVWWDGIHLNRVATKQLLRLSALRNVARTLASSMDDRSIKMLEKQLAKVEANPPVDFEYSKISIGLQNSSGSCWLVGIGYLLLRITQTNGFF